MPPAPPDETTLRQVAEVTGRRFFSAPTNEDRRAVYADLGSKLGLTEQLTELTVIPLAVAVLLFLASAVVSLLVASVVQPLPVNAGGCS